MHQEINKSRHQIGLCMGVLASQKHNAHGFQANLTWALVKENVHRGVLFWLASGFFPSVTDFS